MIDHDLFHAWQVSDCQCGRPAPARYRRVVHPRKRGSPCPDLSAYYLEKNVRGEGNLAVESAVKYWDRGALTKGLEETQAIYAEARKTPDFNMTTEEFRMAVSKAMRRGDVGENDAVSKAASVWRDALFEPLKNQAIEVGLLPPDVHVKTAVSYLTRIWNSPRLNAGEARFKSIVAPWIDEQLAQLEFKADEIRIGNKIVDVDKQREALPLRTADEDAAAALLDNLDKVAAKWLEDVGLSPNASVKEVRDFIDRVTGAEKNLDGMDSRISRLESELADFDAAGDKLINEREISAMEARTLSEGLTNLELELDGVRDLANASPRVSLVVDYATTKRDLFKAKLAERSLRKRVEALKRMEAEGKANDDMLAELAAKSVDLGRMQADIDGLKVKADKLEPMVPKVKQEIPEFVSPQDRADYVNEIVNDIFNQLTGRAHQGMPSYDMVMSARGPLKERTFNIPDHLIEEFLEHDIELIARRYARVMAADVELTRMDKRHGGSGKPTLQTQLDRLKNDYLSLRQQVEASDMDADAKAKELKRLKKREQSDVEDFSSVRDLLRGQYKVDSQHTSYARVLRTAGTFNYIRQLGGVLVASLTDAVRPAMVHGLGRYMSEGIAPLMTNLDAVKLAVADAKTAGAVTERMTQSRIATMAELADPYAQNSPFERLIDNMGTLFSRMTLLSFWNDWHKSVASVLVQNRILKNAALGDYAKLDSDERRYMGFLGIDEHMAERITRQFDEFGQVDGNVHIPGIERWTDEEARRAFAGGLNKDVDSIIVTKSVADVPLFAHTPTGRALLQFKTFAIASNQRVLMRGLQEGPGKFVTGTIAMSTLGMAAYYFKQMESGRELSNNPGTWIAEGFERSGILSVGMEINNTWEKIGGPGFFALASATGRLAVPGADGRQPASRYANRDAFGALLGPSFQLGTDAAQLLGVPARGLSGDLDVSPADVGRATGMIPFVTLPYWRWILEGGFNLDELSGFKGVEPSLKEMVD